MVDPTVSINPPSFDGKSLAMVELMVVYKLLDLPLSFIDITNCVMYHSTNGNGDVIVVQHLSVMLVILGWCKLNHREWMSGSINNGQ